jgi:hypothetical protein
MHNVPSSGSFYGMSRGAHRLCRGGFYIWYCVTQSAYCARWTSEASDALRQHVADVALAHDDVCVPGCLGQVDDVRQVVGLPDGSLVEVPVVQHLAKQGRRGELPDVLRRLVEDPVSKLSGGYVRCARFLCDRCSEV